SSSSEHRSSVHAVQRYAVFRAARSKLIDVYVTTTITSHFTYVSGIDTTRNAAISVAGRPPIIMASEAPGSNLSSLMNRALAIGIRNAHEPIMIGNAVVEFMPSRLTRIMHGP